jgi:hypothetical protein
VTAANTDDQIEHAIGVLAGLRDRFRLRPLAARSAV